MINDARKCYITYHANAHEQLHKAYIYIYKYSKPVLDYV